MAECKECQVNYNREAMVKIKMKKNHSFPFMVQNCLQLQQLTTEKWPKVIELLESLCKYECS